MANLSIFVSLNGDLYLLILLMDNQTGVKLILVSLIHLLAVLPLLLPAQPLTTNLPIVRIET
ncbi:MAG TPA: hypothetical protein PKE06_15975, partial [Flavilitoribacter sp.]|nr:hypothetical protein [Flavilitoribacter sp.]